MRYHAQVFNLVISSFFFRMGLCSHTIFFCRLRGGSASVGFGQDDDDRVDSSPRDHQWSTCAKWALKSKAGWATRGWIGIIRSSSWLTRNRFLSWSSSGCRDDRDLHRTDGITSFRDGRISIGRPTKEHQRDRGAIAIRRP